MSTTPSVRTVPSGRSRARHQAQHEPRHRHCGPPRRKWGGSRRLIVSLAALLVAILALNGFIQASGAPTRTSSDKDVNATSLTPPAEFADPTAGPSDAVTPAEVDDGPVGSGAVAPGLVAPGSGSRPVEVAAVRPGRSGTPAGAAGPRTAARAGGGPASGPAGRSAASGSAPAASGDGAARSVDGNGGPDHQLTDDASREATSSNTVTGDDGPEASTSDQPTGSADGSADSGGGGLVSDLGRTACGLLSAVCG